MNPPKILLVFYSRSGNTRQVAEIITERLGCNAEEIRVENDRGGVIGYLNCGREAMKEELPKINALKHDPSAYDIVVVGTPVWAFKMSSPIRTFLNENRKKIARLATFSTKDSAKADVGDELAHFIGKESVANMALKSSDIKGEAFISQVEKFISEIKRIETS